MLKSILTGIFVVAVVCWAMGAYNRIVRLRAATMQAWAVLQSLRLQRDKEHAEPMHPEHTTANGLKIEAECLAQSGLYDLTVAQYNEAIVQLPASWLAMLFGFKPIRKEVNQH